MKSTNSKLTPEFIQQEMTRLRDERLKGNWSPPTLEDTLAKLESGEITQAEFDKIDEIWELTPEATAARVKETRSKMRLVF